MKTKTRSIRLDENLLKEADDRDININRVLASTLERLLQGKTKCPICGSKLPNKKEKPCL